MKKNNLQSVPIFLAFLCMGFGDVAGPLTSQIQNEFQLSNFLAGLITFAGFISFGLLSIPMGLFQDRKGKKYILMLGLIVAFAGLILPIIGNYSSFILLLVAILLLGVGATTLQVAGNPIMRDVSPEGKYSRNLSYGQFIKAIGSLSGALIPLAAVNYFDLDWKILFPIYSVIILITVLFTWFTKIQEKERESEHPASFSSCFSLMKNKYIALMVMGIFLYVGSEVTMSARLPSYLVAEYDIDVEKFALGGTSLFFIALMLGRFLGGVILNWIKPKTFLIITTFISLAGLLALFLPFGKIFAFAFIFIIGLGFANIFPLIFSITIDSFPERSNEISGLMVTAIIGGAIIPLLFGMVADFSGNLLIGFIVPIICILYLVTLSFQTKRL